MGFNRDIYKHMANKDPRYSRLEVGQEILLETEDLPRIVEMIPAKGKEGDEDYEPGREGEISSVSLKPPLKVKIVSLDTDFGKNVGVELPEAPKGHRWYDAHEADGAAKLGFGWFVTLDDVQQANPKLFKKNED